MSLATRCSSCETAFRVVQDQLNISEGWVRCGRCGTVFNAALELFDLGSAEAMRREALPVAQVAAPSLPPAAATGDSTIGLDVDLGDDDDADTPPTAAVADPVSREELLADPTDARLFGKRRHEGDKTPAVQVNARDRLEFSDARFDSNLFEADEAAAAEDAAARDDASATGNRPLESLSAQQPDFLRRAEERARWRSRPARFALVGLVAVGGLALVLQVGHHFRDALHAERPATATALDAWCRIADCTIDAPRQVKPWAIENSAMSPANGSDAYLLAVTLRNRASHALAVPWVELSLTDANGRLVARKALSPADFRSSRTAAAGQELALQLAFHAGSARVAGYNIHLFHP